LPPVLQPLAGPAAAGLKEIARRNAPRLLGSAAALTAWQEANRAAHETLLRAIDGADVPVDLDLGALLEQVAAETGLPPAAVDRLPPDIAQLQIAPPEEIEKVRTAIDAFRAIGWVLFGLALVAFAAGHLPRIGPPPHHPVRRRLSDPRRHRHARRPQARRRLGGQRARRCAQRARRGGRRLVDRDLADVQPRARRNAARADRRRRLVLAGPGTRATKIRHAARPAFDQRPAVARAALALLLLLLILWGPVPWTGQVLPLLLLTVAAFVWLELLMRRTIADARARPATG
jgi:hypothetical protein